MSDIQLEEYYSKNFGVIPICDCYDLEYERCNGTKNRERCSCQGIMKNCDFYPEYRERDKIREEQARMKKTIYAHMPPFDSVSEATEYEEKHISKILDSGNRREFETGAVRDIQEGKGRCDLMPLDVVGEYLDNSGLWDISEFIRTGNHICLMDCLRSFTAYPDDPTMLLEVSKHFEEGAKKYGEHNWQKGIPTNCYIDSAVRHYLKFLRGDKDEPHDRAFVWNIMCCIWTCEHKPELNVYRKEEE